jgi:hypothetical protein
VRLYIAGPMSGLPDFNYPAFRTAEKELQALGYETLNPVDNVPVKDVPVWLDFMRMSLVQIAQADGIALLPGWENSPGAMIEQRLGTDLGLPVEPVETWLDGF